jgi:hypothetical protein
MNAVNLISSFGEIKNFNLLFSSKKDGWKVEDWRKACKD